MRNLLALMGAALLMFAGVGWYLNWYSISKAKGTDGESLNIGINSSKIKADVHKVRERIAESTCDKKHVEEVEPQKTDSSDSDPE
ncbi:MAG: hypothetical protein KatS3mg105_2590 [Gemmatales bacterium]|nr:MAG: hypothetical protein KatS3mg105_2590 [Gemmatales bacterium]